MRDVVLTDRGPKPIGPYSQAVRANGFLFVSGQIALDPKTGEMTQGDIVKQTERVLENVKGIVEAAGSKMPHVVKTTVFLKDMNDFAAMNEVYSRYFTLAPPARSTVQAARLPKDALIEIDVMAGYGRSGLSRAAWTAKTVTTATAAMAYQTNLLVPALTGGPLGAGLPAAGAEAAAASAGVGSKITR